MEFPQQIALELEEDVVLSHQCQRFEIPLEYCLLSWLWTLGNMAEYHSHLPEIFFAERKRAPGNLELRYSLECRFGFVLQVHDPICIRGDKGRKIPPEKSRRADVECCNQQTGIEPARLPDLLRHNLLRYLELHQQLTIAAPFVERYLVDISVPICEGLLPNGVRPGSQSNRHLPFILVALLALRRGTVYLLLRQLDICPIVFLDDALEPPNPSDCIVAKLRLLLKTA